MTPIRSRTLAVALMICGAGWNVCPTSAEEQRTLPTSWRLLLQSGPGNAQELTPNADRPAAEILPTGDTAATTQDIDHRGVTDLWTEPSHFLQPMDSPEGGHGNLGALLKQASAQELMFTPSAGMNEDGEGELGWDGYREDPERDDALSKEDLARRKSTLAQLQQLRKPIGEVKIEAIEPNQRVPENRALALIDAQHESLVTIVASGLGPPLPDRYTAGFRHRPLLYEQRNLERCGRGFGCVQNAVSAFQFLADSMVLPYRVCSQRAACLVPAGGDCKTCQEYPVDCNPFPLHVGGSITQAAAMAGFTFLLL